MALELEGTLRQKLLVQSGASARGQWMKQEFILEYPDGNFTAQAFFTAFGQDKVAELDKYQVGDRIRVSFNIKSREFNGRQKKLQESANKIESAKTTSRQIERKLKDVEELPESDSVKMIGEV